jgi:5-methylcytosine-specific restriction enzyme subunit McrC
MSNRIILDEYGSPLLWSDSQRSLELLKQESRRWKRSLGVAREPFAVTFVRGRGYFVRAQGVAGFVQVGTTTVEVRPKFLEAAAPESWRRALWEILSAVEARPVFGGDAPAEIGPALDFPDLLGWVVSRSLSDASLLGVPRGYAEARDDLPVLRGRLDLGRVSTMLTRPDRLPCIYDVFVQDTPLTRLLKWTSKTLSALVRSAELARNLADLWLSMGAVADEPPGTIEADRLRLPGGYSHLGPAVRVGQLLLRRESLVHGGRDETAPSFLWNSAVVYERFVKHLLRRLCRQHGSLHFTDAALALGHTCEQKLPLLTYPDARLVNAQGRTRVLVDAKYKVWSGRKPSSSDLYQVLAGGRAAHCSRVYLAYPKQRERPLAPAKWTINHPGRPASVTAVFIDLERMATRDGERRLVDALSDTLELVAAS